jgi:hypothetical protein
MGGGDAELLFNVKFHLSMFHSLYRSLRVKFFFPLRHISLLITLALAQQVTKLAFRIYVTYFKETIPPPFSTGPQRLEYEPYMA